MALEFTAGFEVSPNGTQLTAGNTGFDSVAATGAVSDNSVTMLGSWCAKLPVTTTELYDFRHNYTARATNGFRFYGYMTAGPPATATLAHIRLSTTIQAQIRLNTNRTLQLRNATTSTGSPSTTALPTSQMWRLEWKLDNSAGTQLLRIFIGANVHGTVPDEEISGTYNTGTSDNVHVGTLTSVAGAWTLWIDDFVTDTVDWPGTGMFTGTLATTLDGATLSADGSVAGAAPAAPTPSRTGQLTILVTNRNLGVLDVIRNWISVECVLRFNEPGSGTVVAPATDDVLALLEPGNRIVVIRDGVIFAAGPIEAPGGPYNWAVDGENSEPGTVSVSFAEDSALIAGRVTYPNPALASTDLAQPAQWTVAATNAEVAMRSLVNLNAGPGALVVRRVPQLVLGTLAGVGSNVNWSTRWQPLGDDLRSIALAGGGLGFRTRQVGTTIEFQVYDPADLTSGVGAVRFSRGLGNLRSVTYTPEAPTATVAVIGGAGEGADREIRERINSSAVSAWWRLETFVDQQSVSDDVELDQAGDEALAEGGETAQLATVTVDTDEQRFGVHFGLGDKVSVEVRPGTEVADLVRQAQLTATPETGEQVTTLVGSQEASNDPDWVRATRNLARRLGRLEAR